MKLHWRHVAPLLLASLLVVRDASSFAPPGTATFSFLSSTMSRRQPPDTSTSWLRQTLPPHSSTRFQLTLSHKKNSLSSKDEVGALGKALRKYRKAPVAYLMIPFVAAFIGWFTNWLALKLVFCRTGATADALLNL